MSSKHVSRRVLAEFRSRRKVQLYGHCSLPGIPMQVRQAGQQKCLPGMKTPREGLSWKLQTAKGERALILA